MIRLSQPTISEHVRLLEEHIGEKLLDRLGREVLPTGTGEILYRYATRILRLKEEALQAIAHHRGELSGHLTLGASTIPGTYILPGLIAEFKKDLPKVRTTLQIANSLQIVRRLVEGEIELAVIGAEPRDARVNSIALFADELILVVAADHPWAGREEIVVSDLAELPLLWREQESGTRISAEQALQQHGIDLSRLLIVAEMGSAEAVRQAAKAGIGAAILSSRSVHEDLQRGTLVRIPIRELQISRSFHLINRRNRQLSPLAGAFREILVQAGELPGVSLV
jgi:DNA-binding transcriptional LysR family regulator